MALPAAGKKSGLLDFTKWYYTPMQTAQEPGIGQQLMDFFKSTLSGTMSPEEMFRAESAPIESSFEEAGEKMRSRLAASGGAGNVRAIQAGEERLAKGKGEALGKLRSEVSQRSLSSQLLGAQLLKLLRELGAGGFSGAGTAYFGG
jgi:hypothetical protein